MAKRFLPAAGSLLYLSWTVLIAPSCSQNAPTQTCDPGWFGSNCRYKCRCRGRPCDPDGMCSDGLCALGWFGPDCQYVDLTTNHTSDLHRYLYDGDGLTCEQNKNVKLVEVIMPFNFSFTWLRLQVRDPSLLHAFHVTFADMINKNTLTCKNMRNATGSNNTLDIHCDLDVLVSGVFLDGEGIKSLCSLYISGGRNVALRQNTTQSSTLVYTRGKRPTLYSNASNAVDGNRTNDYFLDSCTHTLKGDANTNWRLTLSSASNINRYVLYNRNSIQERLVGFTLTSFTNDRKMVFNYTDSGAIAQQVYTITNGPKIPPVSEVNIRANNTVPDPVLTLCEVELYGDTACPPSKYGRECEHTCNCAVKDESCFVSTGGCPSGCAAGFQGESCDKSCDFGKYGLGCSSNCSQFCVPTNSSRSPCFPNNGACVHGCVSGYKASECEYYRRAMDNESIRVAVVVYPLIAVVILVVVVVLGVILRRRRRSTSFKQSPIVVNGDDDHYNKLIDTELNLTITPERNQRTQKRPTNNTNSPKQQTTQDTVIHTNSLVNVVSNSDDSSPYEEIMDTRLKQINTTGRNELNIKSPGNCKTTPKQTAKSITIQNKLLDISNSEDANHYEEMVDTELTQINTTGRNEQEFKIHNNSGDTFYYNTVAGM